ATKSMGTVGTTWFHPEPREGLRSESGFALDLSRALSRDDAGSCIAQLPHPGGPPGKDGLEAYGEALMCPEELRAEGKGHSPHRGLSHVCGYRDMAHPQGQDTKEEVPASWVAGGGSMLHGPCWAPTLPLQEDDSFEMEEVQSTSEDEVGTPETAAWLPAPALTRHRRRFMLHAHSTHSDSSGFVEEPAPNSTPTTQLPDAACSELGRPMEDPCGTGQAV
ncbi:protein TESPA1, partial [Chelydra serpentina]